MAAMIVAAGLGVPAVQASPSGTPDPMYRLYNPNSGEHFYTKDEKEKNTLISYGWKDEGIAWTGPYAGDPVYRLYNPNAGDHHYTMSEEERDALVKVGWTDEGIGWYSDSYQNVKVYRQYNPNAKTGAHNYTTSKKENDALVAAGWIAEGVCWYGSERLPEYLDGTWYEVTQTTGSYKAVEREDGSYLYAEICDDVITVKEHRESGDVLVWNGTYEHIDLDKPGTDNDRWDYTWTSKRIGDVEGLMKYQGETKVFRFYGGSLEFDISTPDSDRSVMLRIKKYII